LTAESRSRWVSLDGPSLYLLITCLTQSKGGKGQTYEKFPPFSFSLSPVLCKASAKTSFITMKAAMDSCATLQGLVCCGGVVPNLSPVKGKATCTFVNLLASTSLSVLFVQPSPLPYQQCQLSENVIILKKALDVVLMSMYSLFHSSVHSHM